MLRLVTLGGLSLTDASGTAVAAQRRRLALLALLAPAGERGVTRDKLVGYLWPEHPPEAARHALEQLVYYLRRQVSDELFVGPDPLRLSPAAVGVDVLGFERALASDETARAIALYKGPFLDGFYLTAGGEFESWAESHRARLAAAHALALKRQAERAREMGQHTAEIECWRTLSVVDPVDARAALGLVRALAAAGDLPGAIRQAKLYAERVWRDLRAPPDPAVSACVEELRRAALERAEPRTK